MKLLVRSPAFTTVVENALVGNSGCWNTILTLSCCSTLCRLYRFLSNPSIRSWKASKSWKRLSRWIGMKFVSIKESSNARKFWEYVMWRVFSSISNNSSGLSAWLLSDISSSSCSSVSRGAFHTSFEQTVQYGIWHTVVEMGSHAVQKGIVQYILQKKRSTVTA